jgi:hypothetical protein
MLPDGLYSTNAGTFYIVRNNVAYPVPGANELKTIFGDKWDSLYTPGQDGMIEQLRGAGRVSSWYTYLEKYGLGGAVQPTAGAAQPQPFPVGALILAIAAALFFL